MIPSLSDLNRLHAELCTGLADPTRLAILYALAEAPVNVSELTRLLNLPQSTVSRHLRVLRTCHLVRAERQGQSVVYELTDRRVITALDLLRDVLADQLAAHAHAVSAHFSTVEE